MRSEIFYPSADLQHIVKYFWTLENAADDLGHYRFFPDGFIEISFDLINFQTVRFSDSHKKYKVQGGVFGQFCRHFNVYVDRPHLTFMIKFFPWSLGTVLPQNITDFNECVTETGWISKLREELRDVYFYEKDLQSVVRFAEKRLLERVKMYNRFDLVKNLCQRLEADFRIPTGEILSDYGLSKRRLEQIFKEKTGLSPKHYQRIIRFRQATEILKDNAEPETSIYKLGYFDWSHFSKDMNYFTDLSPTEFTRNISPTGILYNLKPSRV